MARKKKEEEVVEFKPSSYQKNIFDFITHGQGNSVIEAVPGAGKTTTALKCVELMGDSKILLTAFNKDIVNELNKRVKKLVNKDNVDCQTMHSIGLKMLFMNYPKQIDPKPNEFKYKSYVNNNILKLSNGYSSRLNKKDKDKYIENILKYVNFGRYFMCSSVSDMSFIEQHYHIPTYNNEKELALKVMEWGQDNIDTIDFTDMVWLPNVILCKPYNMIYDWIVCDECQDIMTAERMLLLKCTKMSTRMLFFGEKMQCIYSFMGSDYRSFDELRKLPNTISLPLSISYRCSKNVVNHLHKFNEKVEAREDAPDGNVIYNANIEDIKDGDMVLCRNNAPLLQLYCILTKLGKPSYIRGKDIGKSFIRLIEKTKETEINRKIDKKGLFSKLYNDLIDLVDIVMDKYKVTFDMAIEDCEVETLYDQIQALDALSEDLTTTEELVEKIKSLFTDNKSKGIQLSTIHKAKGLECDNIFICCPSLMPSKNAIEKWEKEQERNLEYVAYSRSKNNLYFLNENDFTNFTSNNDKRMFDLRMIKDKVFNIYGDNGRCQEKNDANQTINNKTKMEVLRALSGKTINIGNIDKTSKVDDLRINVRKRKKMVR